MKKILLNVLCLLALGVSVHAQVISTIAGNGVLSFSGDGGYAPSASLAYPFNVAVDAIGNVYVTDAGNNRVRKIDINGIITTIAGSGCSYPCTGGFGGDGFAATLATLSQPSGIAVDAVGNIYFSDYGNNRVRKIDLGGKITTFAGGGPAGLGDGGPATLGVLTRPDGIAIDAVGNVYIADYSNHRIRKVDLLGKISTIAGNSIAGYSGEGIATAKELSFPTGVAIDASGNIYISDYGNNRIRKVSPAGIISTYAGSGVSTLDGVAATTEFLNQPYGVATDAAGNLYIACYHGNDVRIVNTAGIINTAAGTGVGGYNGDGISGALANLYAPTGVGIDRLGNIYIADNINQRVREISVLSQTFNYTGGMQTYSVPSGIYSVKVDVRGATGGLNSDLSIINDRYGDGGCVVCTLAVTPGQVLNIVVGGQGGNGSSALGGGIRGYNGGGYGGSNGSNAGGGGGGASDIRIGGVAISDRKVIAGGGGGAGWFCGISGAASREGGGDGGGPGAADPGKALSCILTTAYTGATGGSTIGGAGGQCTGSGCVGSNGAPGSIAQGGDAGFLSGGGGGGGGYYGGGGAQMTGGGGGSSWVDPSLLLSPAVNSKGCNASGNGVVSIIPICPTPNAGTISGGSGVCLGSTILLTDAVPGGVWTSSNTTIADVGSVSGIVTGVSVSVTSITYTVSNLCGSAYTYSLVAVNPYPASITGTQQLCTAATSALSNSSIGGTWTSANTSVAKIGSSTGIAAGVAAGTASITYSISGCPSTTTVTVSPLPVGITGTAFVCTGTTTALSNTTGGGAWSSNNTSIAAVGSNTGVVTGVAAGTTTISYSLPTGCSATTTVTVHLSPNTIRGATGVCAGATTGLSNTVTGGVWSSSNTSIASIGSGSGIVAASATLGTSTIIYALAGCSVNTTVTVTTLPSGITGASNVCAGLTTALTNAVVGGGWFSSNTSVATVNRTGITSGLAVGTATITYSLGSGCITTSSLTVLSSPSGITGVPNVCAGSSTPLSDATAVGIWSSSNTTVATVTGTGTVNGLTAGTATISYLLGTCPAITTLTVHPLPTPIFGSNGVCVSGSTTLSNGVSGGVWSSSITTTATIGTASGIVSGSVAGTSSITYTLAAGCFTNEIVTVNPLPSTISGTMTVCVGATTLLSDAGSGGWTTAATTASVSPAGLVTGNIAGTGTITYSLPVTGCTAVTTVTINALPVSIAGVTTMCAGVTNTLSDGTGGGTWSSGNTSVATIVSSGNVTGVATGTSLVTYALSTGCSSTATININLSPSIITGTTTLCEGGSVTALSNSASGGAWTSSNTAVATIDAVGTVTSVAAGTSTIVYTIGSCAEATNFLVNPLPLPIDGTTSMCIGSATILFDAGVGSWSSSTTTIATVAAATGIVSGVTPGVSIISYTLGTGCLATTPVTVAPLPPVIKGLGSLCPFTSITLSDSLTGGTWGSGSPTVAVDPVFGTVTGVTTGYATVVYGFIPGCVAVKTIIVNPLPMPIVGVANMCSGQTDTVSDASAPAGNWTSTLVTVSPAGLVSAFRTGAAIITYTLPTGCNVTAALTVNPVPAIITGLNNVCTGNSVMLTDVTSSGTWSSLDTTVVMGATPGNVQGVYAGPAAVSYTLPTGCMTIDTITVYRTPVAIIGKTSICNGATVAVSDTTVAGGVWNSSTGAVATIGAGTGLITGVSPGTTLITYTTGVSCSITKAVTVTSLPVVYGITGGGSYCATFTSLDTGLHIGLSGSDLGIKYYLYNGGSVVDSINGTARDFGLNKTAGIYTVIATNTTTKCSDKMADSTVITPVGIVPPSVSITSSVPGNICAGRTPVTYSANPLNQGTSPVYVWKVNGTPVGSGLSYTYAPMNSDIVTVFLTSSATCVAPATVYTFVTVAAEAPVTLKVDLTATPFSGIESGEPVTFTANVTNAPAYAVLSYLWYVVPGGSGGRSLISGATASTYHTNGLSNNDIISCIVSGNDVCADTGSNALQMTVITISGVKTYTGMQEMSVLPNPSKGEFMIKGTLGTLNDKEVSVEITDMLGQVVYHNNVTAKGGLLNEHIQLKNTIASGTYLLNIHTDEGSSVYHMVVEQ